MSRQKGKIHFADFYCFPFFSFHRSLPIAINSPSYPDANEEDGGDKGDGGEGGEGRVSFVTEWKEFTQETSLHGLGYFYDETPFLIRYVNAKYGT